MRFIKRPLLNIINDSAIVYPSPSNLPYIYNFGVFISMSRNPNSNWYNFSNALRSSYDLAFASVEHIMRDVNYGWLRYLHANGLRFSLSSSTFIFFEECMEVI